MHPTSYPLRIYLLTLCVLVGFGVLLSRLYDYQINQRVRFLHQIPSNYTVTIREPGIRGEIHDRNGTVLAANDMNYEVVLNLEEIREDYKRHLIETSGKGILRDFNKIKTHTIVNEWVRPKLAKYGLDKTYSARALDTHYITHGGLVPFTFRDDLSYDDFAYFAEHNLELPGVDIRVSPRRKYFFGSLASHILGYIQQWEKGKITPQERRIYKHYTGDPEGVKGIESSMNDYLRGVASTKTLLKNEKGKVLRLIDSTKPNIGSTVELTIDARLQYLVENTLRRIGRGAAVVLDVQTGEVLAMASVPDFTPSYFVSGITLDNWNGYLKNKGHPLVNKAISPFTPGSVFKLPTAIAASGANMTNRIETCSGHVAYGRINIHCWKRSGHGTLSLEPAIAQSCNVYFMKLANALGTKRMVSTFEMLGLGKKTGVELPAEATGFIPGSRYWKDFLRPGAYVTPAILGMLSIGQGDSAATPLQMACIVAAIANGGKLYTPRIVKRVLYANKKLSSANPNAPLIENKPILKLNLLKEGIKAKDLARIRQGMWMAVNTLHGTAKRTAIPEKDICAKTGTAQTVDHGLKSHDAWTVAFAPLNKPRYAVVVAVHRGEHGGSVAAPLVRLIFQGLFAQESGIQLPLAPMEEYKGDFLIRESVEIDTSKPFFAEAYGLSGETGDESGELTLPPLHSPQGDNAPSRTPTIRPEADREGSTAPRAILVE